MCDKPEPSSAHGVGERHDRQDVYLGEIPLTVRTP